MRQCERLRRLLARGGLMPYARANRLLTDLAYHWPQRRRSRNRPRYLHRAARQLHGRRRRRHCHRSHDCRGPAESARRSIDAAAGDWPVGACPQCASVVGSEKQIFGANQQVPQRDNFTRRQRQHPLRVSAAGLPLWRRRTAGKTRMRTVVQTIIVALAVACCASACTQEQRAGCVIKGNISSSGERIYHVPGQRYYDKTLIHLSKGERWFCTEQEAVAAGWRKAKV